ncbi:glutamate synthase large subunit [Flavobacteriaceae bacterium]|nr:glutamate synthase large subunit [Flavobacteriaceae bacterium]
MRYGLYSSKFEHENCGAGFICNLNGHKSNQIIHDALNILVKLEHRGGVSSDGITGDGAGILFDIPHDLFAATCQFDLPEAGHYAVAMAFLPKNPNQRKFVKDIFEKQISRQNLEVLGWRKVPVNKEVLGPIATEKEPEIEQLFVARAPELTDLQFQAKLLIARKITEHKVLDSRIAENHLFYISSFSTKIIIYKGIITPEDINRYFVDLNDERLKSKLAIVHQRFSTNTLPSWDLAQPFRYMCQNGEINTLRGNINRMRVREELIKSELLDGFYDEFFPTILDGKSDSASMDMVIELLLLTGRTLPEVMMLMVPEAWEKNPNMSPDKKAFYQYHSNIMEPWDGPASIPFTDGHYLGALLDRNGLRPSRYTLTKDGTLVMSSEIGVLDIEDENIKSHGRLEPGKMFLVDMEEGRIINDEELKTEICAKHPYQEWLEKGQLELKDIPYTDRLSVETESFNNRERLFNYTIEEIQDIITPMAQKAKEALGSMGNDTPLAVLSDQNQLLPNYFKQLFAQVTNPPLDGIREEIVTDLGLNLGKDNNIFTINKEQCQKLHISNPVISNADMEKIRQLDRPGLKAITLNITYEKARGMNGLEDRLLALVKETKEAVINGYTLVILSDRGCGKNCAPIPPLLAVSYLHHSLRRKNLRSRFDLIVESAEPREPHHFACLFGYGASAVNPYMVNELIRRQVNEGFIEGLTEDQAVENFNTAIGKGLLKIMNKIGISTLNSYRGSQIFEILGFKQEFAERFFPYTPSRIGGIGLYEIEKEISKRYEYAYPEVLIKNRLGLKIGGDYRWRRNGEKHLFNPNTVAKLQQAVRLTDQDSYDTYAELINEQSKHLMTLRGLMEFNNFNPIPLDEVEPWTEIVKRFKTGAMSYGSISEEAHENLAIAMNRIGGKSNSGEGGENKDRFEKDTNGNWRNSAIKQVASGRFGVDSHYLTNAKEIQIKMAQGAKPGEGGQLPGEKVLPWIAKARNSTPFVGLISPPPHHDIYSIEDLAQLIYDLKNANREARINVKLVSEVGVGTIAAGVAKAKADVVLVSGYDGGTGASPLTSLKHTGLPWELGIAETQQTLVKNDLRSRIVVECDGQLKTGRDVAIAALLGAEEFGFATAPLVASGCIMMRKCHLNTCPVGIATQDSELRKNFKGTPEHVINFFYFLSQELREIMSQLGFRTVDEMIGRVDKLNSKEAIRHYKAKGLDLSPLLDSSHIEEGVSLRKTQDQDHNLEGVLDFEIISASHPALYRKQAQDLYYPIKNTNRSVGAILSNEISKIYGQYGLPEDTLNIHFKGSAGQSFGAFTAAGLSFHLEGNANDYLGKGLSGGKLIVKKPAKVDFKAHENIITGNVNLFGATKGYAYINGIAGERFAVRNSGAHAVVEGVGDHGCEYMTGGLVAVLGGIGRNFAAGMSGGKAFLYKGEDSLNLINTGTVDLESLDEEDRAQLYTLIHQHAEYTDSELGHEILTNWEEEVGKFIKVMPREYKAALERIKKENLIWER